MRKTVWMRSGQSARSFSEIQHQARALLVELRREIAAKEAEIALLKKHLAQLRRFAGPFPVARRSEVRRQTYSDQFAKSADTRSKTPAFFPATAESWGLVTRVRRVADTLRPPPRQPSRGHR